MGNAIDFVITWVDSSDPKWRSLYQSYRSAEEKVKSESVSESRFRDWGNLHYWFRSIERYCPWVNKVHFVTFGHLPAWLNLEHPKLNVVSHEDIIPPQFLPTFNSRVIEIYLHNIKGLSEKFVYFNDDTFVVKYTPPEYFFRNELPCDALMFKPLYQKGSDHHEANVQLNSLSAINDNFNKKSALISRPLQYFNYRYPAINNLCNLFFCLYEYFPGFVNFHTSQAYLREAFEEVWRKNRNLLLETSANRFRQYSDVNIYLMRYWSLASGRFYPANKGRYSKYVALDFLNIDSVRNDLTGATRFNEICLNDIEGSGCFEELKAAINEAFLVKLSEPSLFERLLVDP